MTLKKKILKMVSCVLAGVLCTTTASVGAYANENVNLSVHKSVTATAYEDGNGRYSPAEYAIDGDKETRFSSFTWNGTEGTASLPQAIMVDLWGECNIESVKSYWYGNNRTYTFNLYITNEPTVTGEVFTIPQDCVYEKNNLQAAGSGTEIGNTAHIHNLSEGVKGRYVTLYTTATTASAQAATIFEIEVNGSYDVLNIYKATGGITVPYGTSVTQIGLPDRINAVLNDKSTISVSVANWKCEAGYDADTPGVYVFEGEIDLSDKNGVENPYNVLAEFKVRVSEAMPSEICRDKVKFNTGWKFQKHVEGDASAVNFNDSDWEEVTLPHTWNGLDGQDGGSSYSGGEGYYRGDGWYRKSFIWDKALSENKKTYIEFEGANLITTVFVNGQEVGVHQGGYTTFRFDITKYLADGENTVAVLVNNARNTTVAPYSADYTFFGGIYRDVWLLSTEKVHIDTADYGSNGLYLSPVAVSREEASVNIKSKIVNESDEKVTLTIAATIENPEPGSLQFDVVDTEYLLFDPEEMTPGGEVASLQTEIEIPAGGSFVFDKTMKVESPRLWNGKKDPYRYLVTLSVFENGVEKDKVTDFIGFRNYEIDAEKGFILNGESYNLRGVNRHQDRADIGWAISEDEHDEDFGLIYCMGANAIRLAHYPHAAYFYNLCDMYGLMVWAEIPQINVVYEGYKETNPVQLEELIKQQYNRPSIVVWGLQNEIRSDSNLAREILTELNNYAHSLDPYRYTTQATCINDAFSKNKNWASDTIAYNMYPGWYSNFGSIENFGNLVDEYRTMEERPLGVSEYGYGINVKLHSDNPIEDFNKTDCFDYESWHSEEYGSIGHENSLRDIKERDWLWCSFVWNMFDFTVDSRAEGYQTGINDKGLVTRDRQIKKDPYYLYQANWSNVPMVHINSSRFNPRVNAVVAVKVYSNNDKVTLTVNGKDLGTKENDGLGVFVWEDVLLQKGDNNVVASFEKDGQAYTDSVVWTREELESESEIESGKNSIVDNVNRTLVIKGLYTSDMTGELVDNPHNAEIKVLDSENNEVAGNSVIKQGYTVRATSEDGTNTTEYKVYCADRIEGNITTRATYTEKSYIANLAVDGSLSTRWSAYGDGVPQAIMLDLGEAKRVSGIVSYWMGEGRESKYDIYVTDTPTVGNGTFTAKVEPVGQNLSSMGSGSSSAEGTLATVDMLSKTATGRYVTIYIRENSAKIASIWEIEVLTDDVVDVMFETDNETLNITATGSPVSLCAALYTGEDELVNIIRFDDATEVFVKDIAYVKVFVWENDIKLMPLTWCKRFEIN
ncbi:MAG: discoidin domain-containing protein [Clostridia bacterium]|nr:discoidin domain-containing protein [Clostridia bacterium]